MGYEQLKIKNQICHALYSASNANIRVYEPYLKALDLTYPQYLVMMVLWEKDEISISQVSEVTFFDSGSLTPILKRLAAKGFIKIGVSKSDARQKVLSLSKKGHKLEKEAAKVPELMSCHFNMSWKEIGEMKALLEKYRGGLLAGAR